MLPPKIGDGVLGSNSGGVKPTGASSLGGASAPSAAALMDILENLRVFKPVKAKEEDCFHGKATRSPDFGAGVKREAWVAMAMVEWSGRSKDGKRSVRVEGQGIRMVFCFLMIEGEGTMVCALDL